MILISIYNFLQWTVYHLSNQPLIDVLILLQLHGLLEVITYLEEKALATEVAAHRQEPEEIVASQNMLKVLDGATIVWAFRSKLGIAASFLAELNGGVLVWNQPEMKREEAGDDEPKNARQDVRCHDEVSQFVVYAFSWENGAQDWIGGRDYQDASDGGVEEHIQKVFIVVEADAIRNPRAVMVHLENALIALRTVMAPIRFGSETSLAHPDATELLPFKREFIDSRSSCSFLLTRFNEGCFFRFFSFIERPCSRFDVFVIKMTWFSWVFLILLYFSIRKFISLHRLKYRPPVVDYIR